MSPAVPANSPGAQACQYRALLTGSLEQFIDADFSPQLHHSHRVTTADVDQVSRQDAASQLLPLTMSSQQSQAIDLAVQLAAIDSVEYFTVLGVITTGGWNKQCPGFFLASQANDEAIDGQGLSQGQFASTDGNNPHCSLVWFSFHQVFGPSAAKTWSLSVARQCNTTGDSRVLVVSCR